MDQIPKEPELLSAQIHQESVQHINEWKSSHLNIGILGTTYHRQTFIKTLIGAETNDQDIHDFEIISVHEPLGHVHPENPNVIFWEMPEWLDMNKNEFISLIKVEKYDLLIVCECEGRQFDERDVWMAEQVRMKGKPVFYVKFGKINGVDVEHGNENFIEAIDRFEFQIIEKINNEFTLVPPAYIISPNLDHRTHLDFTQFTLSLIQSLSTQNHPKSELLTFTTQPFSPDIIKHKHSLLTSKVFHSALISTVCGIFTHILPGIGLVIDLTFLIHEIRFYLTQFGLTKEQLAQKLTKNPNLHYSDLETIINKSSFASLILLKDMSALTAVLVKILPVFAAASALDSIKLFPLVGHVLHGSISFMMTKYALIKILNEFSMVALDIHEFVEGQTEKEQ